MSDEPINHSPLSVEVGGHPKTCMSPCLLYMPQGIRQPASLRAEPSSSLWGSTGAALHSACPVPFHMHRRRTVNRTGQATVTGRRCHLCRVGMAIRASQSKQWQEPGLLGPQSRRRRRIEAAAERMGSVGIWSQGESPERGPGPRSIQKEQSFQKRRGWPSLLSLSCSLDGYAVHVDGESLPVGTKRGLLDKCEAHGVMEVGPS